MRRSAGASRCCLWSPGSWPTSELGSLAINLEPPKCFAAEVYACEFLNAYTHMALACFVCADVTCCIQYGVYTWQSNTAV